MHVIENNTFKFVFEHEIGEIGSTANVPLVTLDAYQKKQRGDPTMAPGFQGGEEWIGHTHLEPHETWALANFLTNGLLDSMASELDRQPDCHRQVWFEGEWIPCGQAVLCPACEYEAEADRPRSNDG